MSRLLRDIYKKYNLVNRHVHAPLPLYGLDGRYASSLYTLGKQHDSLKEFESDLRKVFGAYKRDKKFRKYILNPKIEYDDKWEILDELQKILTLHPLIFEFLENLLNKNQLDLIPRVVDKFVQLMDAHRKVITAEVTSSQPLSRLQVAKIHENFKRYLKGDQKLSLEFKIDPTLGEKIIYRIDDIIVEAVNGEMVERSKLDLAVPSFKVLSAPQLMKPH